MTWIFQVNVGLLIEVSLAGVFIYHRLTWWSLELENFVDFAASKCFSSLLSAPPLPFFAPSIFSCLSVLFFYFFLTNQPVMSALKLPATFRPWLSRRSAPLNLVRAPRGIHSTQNKTLMPGPLGKVLVLPTASPALFLNLTCVCTGDFWNLWAKISILSEISCYFKSVFPHFFFFKCASVQGNTCCLCSLH